MSSIDDDAHSRDVLTPAQAAREDAIEAFRRQANRDATARWRSKLSPERKEADRKQERECIPKPRAEMTSEQKESIQKKDREAHAKKQLAGKGASPVSITPVPPHLSTLWWQLGPTCSIDHRKESGGQEKSTGVIGAGNIFGVNGTANNM